MINENSPIGRSISQVRSDLSALTGNSMDLNITEADLGRARLCVISAEGMLSSQMLSEMLLQPLNDLGKNKDLTDAEAFDFLTKGSLIAPSSNTVSTYGELLEAVYSGFAAVCVRGTGKAAAYGVQGYEKRTVSIPENEQSLGAAQDSFTETLRTNISLIRRRLKTPRLRFEIIKAGRLSGTELCLAYISGRVPESILSDLRRKLGSIRLDTVLDSGYVRPYIDPCYGLSVFSGTLSTERPDQTAVYLNEGRAAVLIDGSPFVILIPALFADNFRTMDDSCEKGFYAAFSKLLRYFAFFLAIGLPGLYAAVVMFHPETLDLKLLLNLAAAEESTPYPLTVELLLVMVLFEIMREAGIRLPKTVGGAVSIVGGLMIGDAAVKSGLISQPLLIVVGITATASFVLPELYPAVSVLRIVFILAGGLGGLAGIGAASALLLCDLAAADSFGIEFTAPASPFFPSGLKGLLGRDSFYDYEKKETTAAGYSGDVK
ncbi:MAG: spore germination protein [Ruminococcus sp.]|nr:spore germination protein [Ruminococcus sp.]